MKTKIYVKRVTLAVLTSLLIIANSHATDGIKLDKSMMWTAYGVGSSGYTEASAIADALMKKYGTQIRIMPSGTAIARLLPLKTGRVKYAFVATETYFASEALYDFANPGWGPQDLRILLGRPSSVVFATAADANIQTMSDLRGKRVSYVQGDISLNLKAEALLAYGGLTWDDVEKVTMPSYSQALRGLIDDKVDAAVTTPTASLVFELASSPRGLAWPEMFPEDNDAWERVKDIAPIFASAVETVGANVSQEHPVGALASRYPQIVTYARLSDDEAYNMTKAVVETYDLFVDANKVMPRWDVEKSGRPPVDAPFHDGSVRYLKEIGVWTDADTQWNNQRLERMRAVQAAWSSARKEATEQGVGDEGWQDFWTDYRKKHLD